MLSVLNLMILRLGVDSVEDSLILGLPGQIQPRIYELPCKGIA